MLNEVAGRGFARCGIDVQAERPHFALDEVTEKVAAEETRVERTAAVDEPTRNCVTDGMRVLKDRVRQGGEWRYGRVEVIRAFTIPPTIVPTAVPGGLVVDFFPTVL